MSEQRYSNQKSALEEYFESLLSEEEIIPSQDEPNQDEDEIRTIELKKEISKAEMAAPSFDDFDRATITPAAEPRYEIKREPVKAQSIEEMLAEIEEVKEEPRVLEYAEPVIPITMPLPDVAQPVVETVIDVKTEEPPVEVVTEVEVAEATPLVAEAVVEEAIEEPIVETVVEPVVEQAAPPEMIEGGTPEWAEEPFQCLLFKVGGLSLAVPLVKLNGVIPWSEKVVETPNQTDWYLGVLMNHGHKVQVIDTAVMVLPPEHRADLPADIEERLSHILLVDDQRWGLACDCIGDVVWLKKDEVKWRSNKTKRPWLLGTAIDHMCAVMDTEAFATMLESPSN